MYKNLILFNLIIALIVVAGGSIARLFGDEILFGVIEAKQAHIYSAYVLAAFGVFIFLLAWRKIHRRNAVILSALAALLAVGVQIGLGIGLIKLPSVSALNFGHVLVAMGVSWSYFALYIRVNPALNPIKHQYAPVIFARLLMLLLLLQIALGIWVSIHQAALACTCFPQCNGQWWPDADYRGIIDSFSAGPGEISYPVQVALNWLHRVGALLCFILLNALMLAATGDKQPKSIRNAGLWLSFLLFIQVALGVIGYKFSMPAGVVIAHTIFAALLMLPLIAISFYGRFGAIEEVTVTETQREVISDESLVTETKTFEPGAVKVNLEEPYVEPAPESIYLRLKTQLARTRTGLGSLLENLQIGQKPIDEDLLEEIEASLLMADVGIDVTTKIINRLTQTLERQQLKDSNALTSSLKHELLSILEPCSQPLKITEQDRPFVILVVGVNGVGKTTTIGKLAKRLKAQGKSVMLAAGDTFRAAAVEQLQTWGERNEIHVVAQHTGADSASVIYDGIQSAQSKGVDVLIADTAGRLHTKSNLMEELKKVKRIMAKLDDTAPHEVLLVLDAGTGQNALSQAKLFNETVGLTGLVLTKLDGTAKGGVIFALAKQTGIPIRFIGVGEGIDDLQDFNAENFIEALFVKD